MITGQIIGVFCTLSAVAFGLVAGLIIKILSDDLSLLTTLFYRFLFCLPLILGVALWARGDDFLKLQQKKTMIFRIVFGLTGILLWFLALRNISLGQATAFSVFCSVCDTCFSVGARRACWPFSYGCCSGRHGWYCPAYGSFSAPLTTGILYAVAGAVVHAGLSLSLRRLGKRDEPVTIALLHNLAGFVVWSSCFYCFLTNGRCLLASNGFY